MHVESGSGVELYWLPLGAGGHSVRLNGRVYERVVAWLERREALALYHAALRVVLPEGSFVIEQAPVRDGHGAERGVVAEGAVGSRRAARFRIFRYEVRCWRGGVIPDAAEAVESPRRLTSDPTLRAGSSRWCRESPQPSGAVTSSPRARCGTPTRSSPGCSRVRGSRPRRSIHPSTGVLLAGVRVWSSPADPRSAMELAVVHR